MMLAQTRFINLIAGADPRMRLTNGICFLAAAMYLVWCAVTHFWGIPAGLIPPWLGHTLMAQQILAALIFYPLARSGVTRDWTDPGMAMPQLLWTTAAVIAGYAAVESVRPVTLQTLCLIQIFGFLNLKPHATRWLGGLTIAMLLGMLAFMSAQQVPSFDPRDETLKIGASCFIMALLSWQSSNFAELRQRISADKRILKRALEDVRRITLQDALTGLPNRQYMQDRIEAELDRARRTGSHFSLALLDLDHFKQINDGHGHQVGDDVLISFGQVARRALRETDLIGRWGGEEFVVLMVDTDPAPLGVIGLQRVRTFLDTSTVSPRRPLLRVKFSAGITCSSSNETLEQLMDRADKALYEAKTGGRNRTCIGA
jgi:diguanylate cyclase (GGDEF)-like protein